MRAIHGVLAMAMACGGGGKPTIPTGDDVGDTGGVDETGDTSGPVDTGAPPDTGETDVVETNVPVPTWNITGTARCVDGIDDHGNVLYGDPAVPRDVRVIPGPGIFCLPLGGGCSTTQDYLVPLARVDTATDGTFSITFEAQAIDGLYLYSDTTDKSGVGNCGSGYQHTEVELTALQQEQGFDDIDLDVYSLFFFGG